MNGSEVQSWNARALGGSGLCGFLAFELVLADIVALKDGKICPKRLKGVFYGNL